jgi:GT2 family glycosyltransferase/SAM-dependent methyltransferase/glycosyltransferase involved in cell wall biosynthesis
MAPMPEDSGASFRRRAAAPRLIDWTGERCVPWAPDVQVVYEHFHRYLWAAGLVAGRRVLDLGSGEGFGAALLAESATHVVGIDIDQLTVEHSRLNYAGSRLAFERGSATDLSAHADGSFGAVVAFEIIEHVREQQEVLAEVARVLGDDGILVMSTPDRRMYGETRSEPNPFHERELGIEEFLELLEEQFEHVALWGQRTIAGSHLDALDDATHEGHASQSPNFFIERSGDEWRLARTPAALYCIALASKVPLPALAASSTLADCGMELMRVKERNTADAIREGQDVASRLEYEKDQLAEALEREREHHQRAWHESERTLHELHEEAVKDAKRHEQQVAMADEEVERSWQIAVRSERTIAELRDRLAGVDAQLSVASQANRRVEESVTWQVFQRARSRLYGAIGGERSLFARILGAGLRFAGRGVVARPSRPAVGEAPPPDAIDPIELPEYEDPEVSLVIPVHAHAELTATCLRSIRDLTARVRYEVIVVEDAADPDTQRLLEHVRGAKIIHNEKNIGYLRSVNRGANAARGEWLVLCNNDIEVTRGWLSAMLDCAHSAPDVGVVTPKYIYPDGTLNEAGGIIWRDGTGANYGRGDVPDRFQYEYRREVDYGSAAALMVSAELWRQTGGFDELYLPMYYEDTDLCFRAHERGLRVMYEPEALVVHVEGATAGTDPNAGHKRHQERNRKKFVAKWRERLDAEHSLPSLENAKAAADRHRGPHVLVIDHRVPMWDRDSGSLRMLRMIQALIGLGARVTFLPDNLAGVQPYTRSLQRLGIEVLYGGFDVRAELAAIGPSLRAAILSRPHATSHWLDTVREVAPAARVAYDTVDLHWLREARKGALATPSASAASGNGVLDPRSIAPKARALRELELAMIRACDATLVVSDGERAQVERDVPGVSVLVVPNVHDVEQSVTPPEDRAGILFVGSFEHVPNIDAARRLVGEVMPAVWTELGDVCLTIVGSDPPPEVQGLASPRVHVAGWVEDLRPLLQRSRLLVAPLRYGAGMKGKVTQCLAAGLPVVTTSIGAEGLVATNVEGEPVGALPLLVADDSRAIAAETIRLCTDDQLWRRLSHAGQELIAEKCSKGVVSRVLGEVIYVEPSPPGAGGDQRTAVRRVPPSYHEDVDSELVRRPA